MPTTPTRDARARALQVERSGKARDVMSSQSTLTERSRRLRTISALVGALATAALAVAPIAAAPPANAADAAAYVRSAEWALSRLDAAQVWREAPGKGSGVTVAVIDSGVSPSQPDLSGSLVTGENLTGKQPSTNTNDVATKGGGEAYRGTGVASILAGHGHADPSGTQGTGGMIGLAPGLRIMPFVVTDAWGQVTSTSSESAAIDTAVSRGAAVINISVWGRSQDPELDTAVEYATEHNVVVIAAAGDEGGSGDPVEYPAGTPGVVAVAGVDEDGRPWPSSEYGSQIVLAAPAQQIERSDGPAGEDYRRQDSTAYAAPLVSAEAALLRSEHPTWTAGQIIRVMISTADSPTPGAHDPHLGYGVIDPVKALTAPEPAQTSNPLLPTSSAITVSGNNLGARTDSTTASTSGVPIRAIAFVAPAALALVMLLVRRARNAGKRPIGDAPIQETEESGCLDVISQPHPSPCPNSTQFGPDYGPPELPRR